MRLEAAAADDKISEYLILSTCCRTEIYYVGDSSHAEQIAFADKAGEVRASLRLYSGDTAVRHLHEVAAGLDSMIKGEDEILGQVREAYEEACAAGTAGHEVNLFFKSAITCAKRIKTDTAVSKTSVSVGTLAAHMVFALPREIKRVLIIGVRGKTGTIIAKNLLAHKDVKIYGTARRGGVHDLPGVTVVDYAERYDYIEQADAVISATGSPHYTVTRRAMEEHGITPRTRLFIDVSVPQDIDSDVADFAGSKLYNIDYFKKLSEENSAIKEHELTRAASFVEEATQEAVKLHAFSEITEYIPKMRQMSAAELIFKLRDNSTAEEMKCIAAAVKRVYGGEQVNE